MADIELVNLTKHYKQGKTVVRALDGVSLRIAGGAVDTQTSQELLSLMRWMNREEKVTFVIVTHDLDLAGQADRMIRLKDGRVLADEPVERAAVLVGSSPPP